MNLVVTLDFMNFVVTLDFMNLVVTLDFMNLVVTLDFSGKEQFFIRNHPFVGILFLYSIIYH